MWINNILQVSRTVSIQVLDAETLEPIRNVQCIRAQTNEEPLLMIEKCIGRTNTWGRCSLPIQDKVKTTSSFIILANLSISSKLSTTST